MKIKSNYSSTASGAAARFLIARLEPAGAAVFAMLRCSGGGHWEAVPSHGEPIFGPDGLPPNTEE